MSSDTIKEIPMEADEDLIDPRSFPTPGIDVPMDLPLPAFAFLDPRSKPVESTEPMDLPLPHFAESMELDKPLTTRQKRNQAAKRRRRERLANLNELPHDHPDKLLFYIRCGRKWKNKWVHFMNKYRWWLKRSMENKEYGEGPYFDQYLKVKDKADNAKRIWKNFDKLGGLKNN